MKIIIKFLTAILVLNSLAFSQWSQQTSGTTQGIYGILNFPSLPVSIVVGTGSTILKTTNNGTNWSPVTAPVLSVSLIDITYSGSNTAWICGNGVVFKSTNAGSNWTSLTVPNRFYNSIFFLNDNTGWACGTSDTVIKTTNSGVNWTIWENNIHPDETNNCIQFVSPLVGFMSGRYGSGTGYILRTINGGANWAEVLQTVSSVPCLQMINASTGYAGTIEKIYKTTNGGSNWTAQNTPSASAYFALHFPVDENTGYAVSVAGIIIKTTNGGANWNMMTSGVADILRNVKFMFSSNTTGYVVGNSGRILRTTNGGGNFTGIEKTNELIPGSFSLQQNYPNPFNPSTTIKFSIPSAGNVKLVVYNLLGETVATPVNGFCQTGNYEVIFSAENLSSGTYFYRINADGFTDVKKMILVK